MSVPFEITKVEVLTHDTNSILSKNEYVIMVTGRSLDIEHTEYLWFKSFKSLLDFSDRLNLIVTAIEKEMEEKNCERFQ